MIKCFRHLRSGSDEIFTPYAKTREFLMHGRHDLYAAADPEKRTRAIAFCPSWLDLLTSPLQTIRTLRAREKYTETMREGASSREFATHFDDLVKACTKQKYGIKANFESIQLIFEMEDQGKSVKEVRNTLADSRVFSDKHGVIKFSEHHHLVNFVARTGAVILAAVGIGFLFVFLIEVILSDCVRTCTLLGAIEVFFFIIVLFKAFFSVGFRKSNLNLLVKIISNQNGNSRTTSSASFLAGSPT